MNQTIRFVLFSIVFSIFLCIVQIANAQTWKPAYEKSAKAIDTILLLEVKAEAIVIKGGDTTFDTQSMTFKKGPKILALEKQEGTIMDLLSSITKPIPFLVKRELYDRFGKEAEQYALKSNAIGTQSGDVANLFYPYYRDRSNHLLSMKTFLIGIAMGSDLDQEIAGNLKSIGVN